MRRVLGSCLFVALTGCSLLDWDGVRHHDAGTPSDASSDVASADGGGCRADATWGAPVYLGVESQNGNEMDGRLSQDELTLYYAYDDGSGTNSDLYVSKRASRAGTFSPGTAIAELDTSSNEGAPFPTTDGLTLYFASAKSGREKIYVASRPTLTAAFGSPTLVSALSAVASDVGSPWLLDDDSTLFFADDYDNLLFSATRQGSSFTVPSQLQGVSGLMGNPISPDGLTLFYSVRENSTDHVWTASRATASGAFSNAHVVSELPAAAPTWISPDGCRMILTVFGTKSLDLAMVERAH